MVARWQGITCYGRTLGGHLRLLALNCRPLASWIIHSPTQNGFNKFYQIACPSPATAATARLHAAQEVAACALQCDAERCLKEKGGAGDRAATCRGFVANLYLG